MAVQFSSVLARQLKTSEGKSDTRKKLIIAVRAASRRLGLEDEDRKAIQLEVTGKASMSDMTGAEIGKVLDRLNRDRKGGVSGSHNPHRAHISKVKALWWTLYWLAEIEHPNDAALDAFVRRQTGIAMLRFLDHRHAPSVIEALKAIAHRAGVRWPNQGDLTGLQSNPGITLAHLERHAVLDALWAKLRERRLTVAMTHHNMLEKGLGLSVNHWMWTAHELDECIRRLGKMLHADIAKAARAAENDL